MTEKKDVDPFDSFWDLASMISAKRPTSSSESSSASERPSVSAVFNDERGELEDLPITVKEGGSEADGGSAAPFSPKTPEENVDAVEEYVPERSSALVYVKLQKKPSAFHFYRQFFQTAHEWFTQVGKPADPVPFFSYSPQYSQLNAEQRNYYFWWRTCVRNHVYPPCDVSYLWLFIYEVINLPDLLPPAEGAVLLASVWANYRKKYPRMDKYMTVWFADYCLVNRVPCPTPLMTDLLPVIIQNHGFIEFYLGQLSSVDIDSAKILLSLTSSYDPTKSKFFQTLSESDKEKYYSSMIGIVSDVFGTDSFFCNDTVSVFTRDAFSGSLCADHLKYRIEVGYHSFSGIPTGNALLTSAMKYAENKMRAALGQKSRLSVGADLRDHHRKMLDDFYADPSNGLVRAEKKKEIPVPDYEKLYDAESASMSMDDALSIENESWKNTLLLTEDSDTASEQEKSLTISASEKCENIKEKIEADIESNELSDDEKAFLTSLLRGERVRAGLEELSLSEGINEKAAEEIGDSVTEEKDGYIVLIDDYREDVLTWLRN